MKKAWSFFWLVIASVIAVQIIGVMIGPWLPLIGIALVVIVAAIVFGKVIKARKKKNQFF
ncbi:hypothetical protein QN355_19500 [Cryobacterium sp. 10S3]|uniref:hypothetical protein n=1 Tax=Cryobacterium sp. 10S3 TaxID=3048582 RepID=UPI002AC96A52|nr:hypothetical protein [Cryobacterium sp. 10S3]MEB0288716.1 hypothetical protein [Cryobacterium sp. 10S3]WPX14210.1 hypothetical protein RHM57_02205 [Cryobacterium sp. 10S3]